jgi:hypothetical protein
MSETLEQRMREDRMLRDAARALVEADVANLRASLAERSIPGRVVDRITEGAADALDEATNLAERHRGVIAAIVAGMVLWLARNPILDIVLGEDEPERNRKPGR